MKKKIVFITLAIGTYNAPFFNALNEKVKKWAEIYIIYYEGYSKHIPKNISKDIHLIAAEGKNIFDNKITKLAIKSEDSIIHYFFRYSHLKKILKQISPDIVHTFLYFMPYSVQAAKYCRKSKVPILSYEESQREPYFIITKLLNRASLFFLRQSLIRNMKFLTTPTVQGKDFQSKFLADKNKVIHVPWPVEESKLLKLHRPVRKDKNTLNILSVARMVTYKKYDTIISAATELKERKIPFKLTIIGTGPLEAQISNDIKTNKLDENIEIIPKVDFKKIPSYYLKSDITILASVYESYGMVVPEAMACGCAMIVSDTAGTNFMVEDGKNGYVFKTGDAHDLAEKIILTKNKTEQFGKHSRQLMKTKFSTTKIINDYVNLLKKAGLKK